MDAGSFLLKGTSVQSLAFGLSTETDTGWTMGLLGRLRRRQGDPIVLTDVNFTPEHVALARTVAKRNRLFAALSSRIPLLRAVLVTVGVAWLLALPYEGLWKDTYVDEHAIQPAQVTMYYDWANVFKADRYLDNLECLTNATQEDRAAFLERSFSTAGLDTGRTASATFAHVTPPRSAGTETILLSANWVSRDGGPNLRGVALLLSLGDFLRGQNHWAFDFVLVVGEDYLTGLEGFMREYHGLSPGVIWTALNIDYPGHSFSHLGFYYEGVNGRLPNQDIVNTVSHVARWAGGVEPLIHSIPSSPPGLPSYIPAGVRGPLGSYLQASTHLLSHLRYMALGRPSGAHGVLARHRIDSVTLYAVPATGPHGFHTLGRTIESTLRSQNNLLERLHASYFFYLLPREGKFIPVGHYLPAAILLGASLTIGGFDCPDPLAGVLWLLPAFFLGWVGWLVQTPLVSLVGLALPRPKGAARTSASALAHLLYGALIPTLAMVNFPQAVVLAGISILYLLPWRRARLAVLAAHPALIRGLAADWRDCSNITWVGVFAVWVPLWVIAAIL